MNKGRFKKFMLGKLVDFSIKDEFFNTSLQKIWTPPDQTALIVDQVRVDNSMDPFLTILQTGDTPYSEVSICKYFSCFIELESNFLLWFFRRGMFSLI